MMRILGTAFAGLLGLAFGSFLNVCLSRWPEGESIVAPRSHCRSCGQTLAWWENIPLASWLMLRGRCRTCKTAISWRYPLVELAVGALWATTAWRFPGWVFDPLAPRVSLVALTVAAIGQAIFYWLLIALAILDAENLWLPNLLTWPGIWIGLVFSLLNPPFEMQFDSLTRLPLTYSVEYLRSGLWRTAIVSVLSILVAAGIVLLVRWIYWLVKRQEGIGLGDAKLMAMLGAWLGLPGTLLAFAIGVVLGTVVALVALAVPAARRGSESWAMTRLPLGTFLCIGGVVAALWGPQIIAAYLHMEGF